MERSLDLGPVEGILQKYSGQRGALVSILNEIQKAYRYLPEEALRLVSKRRRLPLSRLFSLASFYSAFSLTPRGEHEICVCMGTACHVRGAPSVLEQIERAIGIRAGETSADGKYTLETVRCLGACAMGPCLGACAMGPIVVVDGRYHGNVEPHRVVSLLPEVKKGEKKRKAAKTRRSRKTS